MSGIFIFEDVNIIEITFKFLQYPNKLNLSKTKNPENTLRIGAFLI